MKMQQLNQFTKAVSGVNIPRSRFTQPFSRKFTMNAGELVPCFIKEALPGDTLSLELKDLTRMATPLFPVMDNAYLDVYFFFVPSRILWEHLEDFYGQAEPQAWTNPVEYTIPQLTLSSGMPVGIGTVYDYMALPVSLKDLSFPSETYSVNVLPFRAYGLIWNEWFRDQNQYPPIHIPKDDSSVEPYAPSFLPSNIQYFNWNNSLEDLVNYGYTGGKPLPVAKFHDYFTSALPSPQKGEAINIPLGDVAPVITGENHSTTLFTDLPGLTFFDELSNAFAEEGTLKVYENGAVKSDANSAPTSTDNTYGVIPANLYTDLSGATAATINSLRMAFTLQRLQERDARSGSRFFEILQAAYGVTASDSRLQRPEYLGGKRVPINVSQVIQQADQSASESRPLGSTGAYSLTLDREHMFSYSCVEPGYFMGVCCIRTNQSYSQGIHRMWSRKRRYDFYDPVFANLPEQPILNKELFVYTNNTLPWDEVFGYQEAWAEYRYSQNEVCGYMRPGVEGSLDVWHYGSYFTSMPTLSAPFISESPDLIDRTLAVTSATSHQFICDFYFNCTWVRPMPMYSIPGVGDNF